MSSIKLSFLNITLNQFELLHVFVSICSVGAAFLLSKVIWEKVISQRLDHVSANMKPLIRPFLTYFIFMVIFLSSSLALFQVTGTFTILNFGAQLSFLILVSYYVFLISKSKLVVVLSLLGLTSIWYLNHLAILKPSLDVLNSFSLNVGSFEITPLGFLKSLSTVLILLWISSLISQKFKSKVQQLSTLKSGTKEILNKSFDIFIYFIVSLMVLNILGINLSSLAVIGGALGVGLGFGLQKITSNFISGLILLFEKSIEIDDLIELDNNIYGFVRRLGSRYTLVETFDGKEILIPNEDFITNRVTNWTFSNKKGRVDTNIGVSYGSDIEKAQQLILESAREHPRCAKDPEPKCYLREFGDSSVNFKLLFFVEDIENGRWEPQSEVMMTIWKKFKEHDIEIPFPQRDIHIKSSSIQTKEDL